MKAKVKATGEIVEVYHKSQHGQTEIIYKEAVFVNGRIWTENELEFLQDKSPCKAKIGGTLKSMLDNMDKDKLAKTREELANSSESCKDLEEAGKEWLRPQLDKSYEKYGEKKMMELTHFDGYAMLEAIEFGAKWKEQQLMKNVVLETEVLRDSDGDGVETPYESWLTLANTEIPELPESLGLKEGDKVKIVIVKDS